MPRLSPKALAASAFLLVLPLAASAEMAVPQIREGLWRSSIKAGQFTVAVEQCMDGSAQAVLAASRPPQMPAGACTQPPAFEAIPGGYRVEGTCTVQGRPMHMKIMMIGDFQTHYGLDMEGQNGDEPAFKMHLDSDWIGACPSDMKPGQVRTVLDPKLAAATARVKADGGQ